jgi:hypothetical protein
MGQCSGMIPEELPAERLRIGMTTPSRADLTTTDLIVLATLAGATT